MVMGSAQANTAPSHASDTLPLLWIALDDRFNRVCFILMCALTVGVCGGGAECVYNCVRSVNNMEINVPNIFIFAI